ncbi:GNAT family N-acetyltransferase [Candidatus Methanomassiliicoccus intestinalis]|uniref:GNAT family N-acetyltransferase n=1 Tax=Candidatus Methanomassiliicoccus intestinalis TaxID=1406512 RepID=UPI0037DDD19F
MNFERTVKMRIEFKKVTEKNIEDILKLKVKDNQKTFIESVPECLKEAAEKSCWRPVGIYDEDILIGFAMYCFWKEDQHVWMDRFLIASEFQGKGYGSAVFPQLLKKIESEYQCSEIYLSVFKDNTAAINLYEKNGFRFNGEKDIKGEDVMVLNLRQPVIL